MTTAVTGTTPSTTSTATTNSQDALNQLSGNFSTFLTLLTTQLKNQDPTSPDGLQHFHPAAGDVQPGRAAD